MPTVRPSCASTCCPPRSRGLAYDLSFVGSQGDEGPSVVRFMEVIVSFHCRATAARRNISKHSPCASASQVDPFAHSFAFAPQQLYSITCLAGWAPAPWSPDPLILRPSPSIDSRQLLWQTF